MNRRVAARTLVWVYALAFVVSVISWLDRRLASHSAHLNPFEIAFAAINVPATASLVTIIGLVLITTGLQRHKRIALLVVGAFQVLGVLADLIILAAIALFDDVEAEPLEVVVIAGLAAIGAAGAAFCWWLRPEFPARIPRGSLPKALAVLASGIGVSVVTTWALLSRAHALEHRPWRQFVAAMFHAFGFAAPPSWHVRLPGHIAMVASILFGATLVATVWIFLRTSKANDEWSPDNEVEARRLLAEFGEDDSLGYLATRRDKLIHFSANRRAAIAYQRFGGVCLASGDPIGDPAHWEDAVASWDAGARRYGWTPAVLACSERGARCYSSALRYDVLRLGDESILHPDRFRLDSSALSEVRRAGRKLRRDGYECSFRMQSELRQAELDEIVADAEHWRVGKVERGFSMALNRSADPSDPRVVVARVTDAAGNLAALMTFVPWGRRGLSLDLMRRSPDAPNGVNEFLIGELMAWCQGRGIARVSLNFAFLRHVFAEAEAVSASPLRRMSSRVLGVMDRFWQLQRLYRSNAKYFPEWVPRYIAVSSMLALPQIAIACGRAEGFLPRVHHPEAKLDASYVPRICEVESPPPPLDDAGLSDQERHRRHHAASLEAAGIACYPVGRVDAVALDALEDPLAPPDARWVSGRVGAIRDLGGVCFIELRSGHARSQLVCERDSTPRYDALTRNLDGGDLILVRAHAGTSRNGTASLLVDDWRMAAKAIRPIPWGGMSDPQARLRARTLDLIVRPGQVDLLKARSRAIAAVRDVLISTGFTEVETPILGTVHGGANARPFRTYINAYDTDLVARIAPELALKKLVVAGMGPVFEIGRNFRNEGADATHNPEFTVVEAYRPFADYTDMRHLTEQIIKSAARAVHGREVMPLGPANDLVDISGNWACIDVCGAVSRALGAAVSIDTDLDVLLDHARAHDIEVRPDWGAGAIIEELYGELVEPATVMPTFYVDFPAETSPLTARHRDRVGLVERWDLVAGGMELGTAYSELADPLEQQRRLVEQSWKASRGDEDAMEVDHDFLAALHLGMPPTGGLGIGLDRLVMALTGTTIRQVLSFPFVRPQRRLH